MPYRPDVFALCPGGTGCPAVTLPGEQYAPAAAAGEKAYTYRLGAPTCLAGDVIGDYSFDSPLQVDDTIILDDMSHYTIVKTTHFNGVPHPDIAVLRADGSIEVVKRFSYADFENRLG
jgi:carboxynorspermidine decarboxylase